MVDSRVAKAFIRKVALYAEQHTINRAAPTCEVKQVGDSTNASQDSCITTLRIIKLQVCGLQLGMSSGGSTSVYLVHQL